MAEGTEPYIWPPPPPNITKILEEITKKLKEVPKEDRADYIEYLVRYLRLWRTSFRYSDRQH